MTKAEISEIKKLFTLKNCSITRICGCYVNGDKDIINTWSQNFLAMDEEDLLKYMALFKKCLQGSLNKTMFNIKPGQNKGDKLLRLKQSKLKDDDMLMEFYRHIIDYYEYVGNYLILVIHDAYDVPGKTSDNEELEDASEEVYEYIMACICPVTLTKPGLGYNKEKSIFTHLERDWVINTPEIAILYPAFNDRSEDREAALYSVKSMDSDKKDFATDAFGAVIEWTPGEEKDIYQQILEQTLGRDRSFQDIRNINEMTLQLAEERTAEGNKVGIEDIREVLRAADIKEEKIDKLDNAYIEVAGSLDTEIALNNIVNRRSFTIKTDHGTITMKPEQAHYVESKIIDGEPCIVLQLNQEVINVDGIDVTVGGNIHE